MTLGPCLNKRNLILRINLLILKARLLLSQQVPRGPRLSPKIKKIPLGRVATDLESLEKSRNLKETSESQGISLKIQGIWNRIPNVRQFCCLKFIFSQVEDLIFENFLGEHAPRPP